MRRLTSNLLYGFVAATSGALGMYKLADEMMPSQSEQLQIIENCAASLGAIGVQTEIYPERCPDDSFPYTYTVTVEFDSHGQSNNKSTPKVYDLPSAEEYRQDKLDKLWTGSDQKRLNLALTPLGAILGLLMIPIVKDVKKAVTLIKKRNASLSEESAV